MVVLCASVAALGAEKQPPKAKKPSRTMTPAKAVASSKALAASKPIVASKTVASSKAAATGNRVASARSPAAPLTPPALDKLLSDETGTPTTAQLVGDEQFLRRVTIDIIGRQPTPAECSEARAGGLHTPAERARTIDRLLASPEFGRNWANYWSDTISYRVPPPELHYLDYRPLKNWFADQFNHNVAWDKIVGDLLSANGMVRENPPATFVAYHQGDAPKLAAETARIFLGVQIQCAECHDHPFEDWRREQFHQLAAFYARAGGKLPKASGTVDATEATVTDRGKGEYRMPNAADPLKDGTIMDPVFLTGAKLEQGASDADRRKELARSVASRENPWFAKAFVNRIWARLLGRGFYEPVDNMAEHVNPIAPRTHVALAQDFAASGFDVKQLYRLILNTRTYQRPLSAEGEQPYAVARAEKLRGDEVFDSLVTAVGLPNITPPTVKPTKEIRFPPPPKSTRDIVIEAFGYDPSLPPAEVLRTMGQAMLLMNNDQLQAQIDARPGRPTLLSKLLASEPDNEAALERLFQLVLARQPTERELGIGREHLAAVGERGPAFEDLLWSLLNTAEFTTKR